MSILMKRAAGMACGRETLPYILAALFGLVVADLADAGTVAILNSTPDGVIVQTSGGTRTRPWRGPGNSNRAVGQTLIAPVDFSLARIALRSNEAQSWSANRSTLFQIQIFDMVENNPGNNDDGLPDSNNVLLQKVSFDLSGVSAGEHDWFELSLDSPVELEAGELYGFIIHWSGPESGNTISLDRSSNGNAYKRGTLRSKSPYNSSYWNTSNPWNTVGASDRDLVFIAMTADGSHAPIVTDPIVENIGQTSAKLTVSLENEGGTTVFERGTVWGTSPNPTGNALDDGGSGTGLIIQTRTGLPSGTQIYFRGYAINAIGTGYSEEASFWTVPDDPTAAAASNVGGVSFTANWNAPTGVNSYRLDVATDAGFTSLVPGYNNRVVPNVTSYSVTGLDEQTTYYYRVRAANPGGISGSSGSVEVQTTDIVAPTTPTALPAPTVQSSSFVAAWDPAMDAAEYQIDVSSTPDFSAPVSGYNDLTVGNITEFEVSGVDSSKAYYFRVRASNSLGTSSSSDTIGVRNIDVSAQGSTIAGAPVVTDRSFAGSFGETLAAGLTGADTSGEADQIHIFDPIAQGFTILWLHSSGEWREGGSASSLVLDPGQGFFIVRNQGTSTAVGFTGSVSDAGNETIDVETGWNLISLSEAGSMTVGQAFSNLDSGGLVENWNSTQADQVILQNANGSWRRLFRTPSGWFDYGTGTINNSLPLEPGAAYYYLRRSGTLTVRF